eukprot:1175462-Prorocentrum_minimum.AAC.5
MKCGAMFEGVRVSGWRRVGGRCCFKRLQSSFRNFGSEGARRMFQPCRAGGGPAEALGFREFGNEAD